MLKIITTTRFEKDLLLQKKRGKDIGKLKKVLMLLESQVKLEDKYRKTGTTFILVRTGSHADLFE